MNTLNKIVVSAELFTGLADRSATLVIGSFDPLLAQHSERLGQIARLFRTSLVVAVIDPIERQVLSRTARLEMVAALGMVDFVLPFEPGLQEAFPWAAVHDELALHDQWSAEFQSHVRRRSQAAFA